LFVARTNGSIKLESRYCIEIYLLYKCVVAKLGSKAGNFLFGNREIEGRDREIGGRYRGGRYRGER